MDSDPPEIPVQPILFAYGLTHFAQSLIRGKAKIVAIGSSTTAGEGGIQAYPERLLSLLQAEYANTRITVVNEGIGGTEAPGELERFATDVIEAKPDLVIWQVGTNAVWRGPPNQLPRPPSFEDTTTALRDGLQLLRDKTQADVIVMDLQYVPALLTQAKKATAIRMVEEIGRLAGEAGVNVFRRFAFMKDLHEIERVSFDRLVDPNDDNRLHDSDWATGRVTWALKLAIVDGVKKVWSSPAAIRS
jgi:lysophospholipase L1-like esterase